MNVDLTRLLNNYIEELEISETIVFGEDYLKNTEIRSLSQLVVKGGISSTTENLYSINMTVSGEMILPCSVTLDDVHYPFTVQIEEILSENDAEEENYIKIIDNTIDIMPIIWQNVVMEIPLKVTSPKAEKIRLQGEGWKLITEDEINQRLDD